MDQDYQNDEFELEQAVSKKTKGNPLSKTAEDTTGYSASILPKVLMKEKELPKKYSAANLNNRNKLHSLGKNEYGNSKSQSHKLETLQPKRRQMSLFNHEEGEEMPKPQKFKRGMGGKSKIMQHQERKVMLSKKEGQNNAKKELKIQARTEFSKVQSHFHHTREQLESLPSDEINRLTNKIKQWIARMNHELDIKINETIRDRSNLPAKVKTQKPQEEVVSLLQSQVVNNESMLALTDKEEMKLRNRTYQCQEEEYEKALIEERDDLKDTIKELQKSIGHLKQHTGRYDDKLKAQLKPAKPQKKIQTLKEEIINEKNQASKNESILVKLQSKNAQLSQTLLRESHILERKISEAKEHHIVLDENTLQGAYKELKEKVGRNRTQNMYIESKYTKNVIRIQNQLKLVRNQIKHYDRDYHRAEERISKMSEQALNLLEYHKDNTKVAHIHANFSLFFSKYTPQQKTAPFSTHPKQDQTDELSKQEVPKAKEKEESPSPNIKTPLGLAEEEECSNEFMKIEGHRSSSILISQTQKQAPKEEAGIKLQVKQSSNIDIPQQDNKQPEVSSANVFPRRFRLKKNQTNQPNS